MKIGTKYNLKDKVFIMNHGQIVEISEINNREVDYRIKPEETKFKVGDWVRDNNCIFEITSIASDGEIVVNRSHTVYNSNIELWEPHECEWVFYSHMTGYKVHRYSDDMSHYEVYPIEFIQTLKD